MSSTERIEKAIESAIFPLSRQQCPPRLLGAIRHAVFPGGARIRPQLVTGVAAACGDPSPKLTDSAATAVELLHCASLVHDDLPCFDDADTRRGKPSVHRAFDQPLAVLAGDALIVMGFEALGRAIALRCSDGLRVFQIVSRGVGAPAGIIAGQAWESEPRVDFRRYHQAKTGGLFEAAVCAGAAAASADHHAWRPVGSMLGEAYQVADDIADACGDAASLGKPVGRDKLLGRPSAALTLGVDRASMHLRSILSDAVDAVPQCEGRDAFRKQLTTISEQFLNRFSARIERDRRSKHRAANHPLGWAAAEAVE
jgi:geranylgeranyl diphosphate synthase type II